ncbi:DoxX family protein [Arcticibacterium luteifluviistationis]|uniref:DoxX family protein n=1 Tax=Arcticibacterium luteifluviistationis TaxID=1784714 RepID=A0A2Z4G8P5_9BACT|nr:DoxX family protein [Arcticibacterium luteifluviistationis]AWV97577.1 DoxX family protein [Arcticibacterium luteifluviistationis]
MLKKFFKVTALPPYVDLAIAILRVGMGFLMIPHGYQKLIKVLNGSYAFGDPLGLGEVPSLLLAIFAELFCSILLLLGLFTKPALAVLIFTMVVAVFVVNGGQGFDKMEKGLLFLIPYISLFIWGPGRYSIDYRLFGKRRRF